MSDGTTTVPEHSLLTRYEALVRVSRAIHVHRDPKELFRVLADELRQAADFDLIGLFLFDEVTNTIQNPVLQTDRVPGFAIPPDFSPEETLTRWVYRHQEPLVVSSRDEETRFPRMMQVYRKYGIESACVLPLTTAHRKLGALGFAAARKNVYNPEEVRFLMLVADQVALAVDNATRDAEQERIKDELRKQTAHFEKLFELAPEPIVLRDVNNRVLRTNKEFTKLFGFTQEEVLGRNISDLIVPDDLREESERLREAVNRGERVHTELVRRRKDGSQMAVSVVAAPVSLDGGPPEIYGIYRDITDRKKAELALKRKEAYLAEGQRLSHTGSWARSVPSGDVFFSLESFRIYGFDPEKTKVTLDLVLSRIHPEDRDPFKEMIDRAAREESDFESDYRLILEDGSIRFIHVVGHPAKNAAGELKEFVGTIMDVTEQHQSRQALEEALAQISALKEQLFQENVALRQEIDETSMFDEIIGKSAALHRVLREIETVGPTGSTVLIHGETGTGKELIARAIHNLSGRRDNAFVKVNCAAIPTGLLESELFGHERGAFTGAIAQRIGRFELANHGTVFLDEIGEIPLELQPKLLRVLQEREFERLGSSRTLHTDARLIAATNQDLSRMVDLQKFRSDLFYRLNVFPIHVPALRERPEDVPLLVRHFAEVFSRRMNKPITMIPPETMGALVRYEWPGNVRELQNVIERAVILSSGGILRVPAADLKPPSKIVGKHAGPEPFAAKNVREVIRSLDRDQVVQALQKAQGRVGGPEGAAARLGLKRTTLIAHMKRLGINSRTVTR
ncbi:MAG TPA: sigma 54-interacting transcriptional regulator [Candidatus Aquilonibacter sp.]|nr:sigma 54-interacting transcriptional regulator [Candidatus Aquilonibacter sp.]